jgi:hypothetical protein
MRYILISILFVSVFGSCKISGLTNDYNTLNEQQKQKIVPLNNFKDTKLDVIYKINGKQLREELKNHNRSLVYVFKNGCTSTYCKPMMNYVTYAKENNYTLFLVMDGYCNLSETTDQYPASILYAIDSDFYKETKRHIYSRYFINELTGKSINDKSSSDKGNLYFFSTDKLDTVLRELPKK